MARFTSVTTLLLASWCASVAGAQPINEDTTYFPAPTLQGAYGTTVDVFGDFMIVGAPSDNENDVLAGAAYLVDLVSGTQIKLNPIDVDGGDQFGFSVAIGSDYAIVGAPFDRDLGFENGAVYIFEVPSGTLLHTIRGNPTSEFGYDVDIDGSIAIIGAREQGSGGEAYLYNAMSGSLLFTLPVQSAFGFDEFGHGVSIDDSAGIACVGAPGEFIPGVDARIGAVHLFDLSNGAHLRTLTPPLDRSSEFGACVDIRDSLVLVGAPKAPDFLSDTGAGYLFDSASGALLRTFLIDDSPSPTQFNMLGFSAKLGDGVALLGAPEWDFQGTSETFNNGAGFLFDTSSGGLLARFEPVGATLGDRNGSGVGISGSTIAIGTPGDDYPGGFGAGSVSIYSYELPCAPDLNMDGNLDFFDINELLQSGVDYNGDTQFDFFDISAFLQDLALGCP